MILFQQKSGLDILNQSVPLWFKMSKPVNFTSVTVRYADCLWSSDWLKDVKFYSAVPWT